MPTFVEVIQRRKLRLLRIAFFVVACFYVLYVARSFRNPTWPPVPKAILPPPPNDYDIHIPFTIYNSLIRVNADIAGKSIACHFDTGSSRFFDASAIFNLSGQITEAAVGQYRPYYTARPRYGKVIILPQVRLGEYMVQKCPTFVFDSLPDDNVWNAPPIIGNSFFADSVLTIDYKKRLFIVHRQGYRLEKECLYPGDQILNFYWKNSLKVEGRGIIVCQGALESKPMEIALDTGLGRIEFVAASPRAFDALSKQQSHAIHGKWITGKVKNVAWSLGKKSYISDVYFASRLIPSVDAVVGLAFLKDYRVTIDYPRQKILLQRNPSPATAAHRSPHSSTATTRTDRERA